MKRYLIITGTVTYGVKGREILRKHGFSAYVKRKTSQGGYGCGYAIEINGDPKKAEELLLASGVKILKIQEAE